MELQKSHNKNRMNRMKKKCLTTLAIATMLLTVHPKISWGGYKVELSEKNTFELFQQIQIWSVYTMDARDEDGVSVDNRLDMFIRRGRLGVKGNLYPSLSTYICLAYDKLGMDAHTGTPGSGQESSNIEFYLWDVYTTWCVHPAWVNLTIGYFRPQAGRESITTAFKIDSFTKALTNTYPREHIVGRGSGREAGVNLGGLYHPDMLGIHYNFGLFDTNHPKVAGQEGGGIHWSPLLTGRIALSYGEPEMGKYALNYQTTYFGKRSGITLAANATTQGKTDQTCDDSGKYEGGFLRNRMAGLDLLANWEGLCLAAEIDWLWREFEAPFALTANLSGTTYTDRVYHALVGWTTRIYRQTYLEPTVMYTEFIGDSNSAENPGGTHRLLDFGFNWYIKEYDLAFDLHYAIQDGGAVSKFSKGEGEKGDFVGMGVQFIY